MRRERERWVEWLEKEAQEKEVQEKRERQEKKQACKLVERQEKIYINKYKYNNNY